MVAKLDETSIKAAALVQSIDAAMKAACAESRSRGRARVCVQLDTYCWELFEEQEGGKVCCERVERPGKVEALVTSSLETFEAISTKKLTLKRALFTGRAKMRGSTPAMSAWTTVLGVAKRCYRAEMVAPPPPRLSSSNSADEDLVAEGLFEVKVVAKKTATSAGWRWKLSVSARGLGIKHNVTQDSVYKMEDADGARTSANALRDELQWLGTVTALVLAVPQSTSITVEGPSKERRDRDHRSMWGWQTPAKQQRRASGPTPAPFEPMDLSIDVCWKAAVFRVDVRSSYGGKKTSDWHATTELWLPRDSPKEERKSALRLALSEYDRGASHLRQLNGSITNSERRPLGNVSNSN